ncbi:MAG TPA: tetratricopeptide repeat protein, partial [Cyanophyceae cyanobacterium]
MMSTLVEVPENKDGLESYQQSIQFHQQQLRIVRKSGDRAGESKAWYHLGNGYNSLGQYQQAIKCYRQSLAIKRTIGDLAGQAKALMGLGQAYHSLRHYQQAVRCHQQLLAILREITGIVSRSDKEEQGSTERNTVLRTMEATSLSNLGNAYYCLGQYQQAIVSHQQSLTIKQEIGDRAGMAVSLNKLGKACCSSGDYQQAKDYYGQALTIKRQLNDRF